VFAFLHEDLAQAFVRNIAESGIMTGTERCSLRAKLGRHGEAIHRIWQLKSEMTSAG